MKRNVCFLLIVIFGFLFCVTATFANESSAGKQLLIAPDGEVFSVPVKKIGRSLSPVEHEAVKNPGKPYQINFLRAGKERVNFFYNAKVAQSETAISYDGVRILPKESFKKRVGDAEFVWYRLFMLIFIFFIVVTLLLQKLKIYIVTELIFAISSVFLLYLSVISALMGDSLPVAFMAGFMLFYCMCTPPRPEIVGENSKSYALIIFLVLAGVCCML